MKKNKPNKRIKAVLFDMGKVILDFNFKPAFRRVARSAPLDAAAVEDYFCRSGLEALYDGGKISSFTFYKEVKRVLEHTMSYAQFKSAWNNVFTENKQIARLIRRLSRDTRLVLISNTNAMHYEYVRKKYPVLGYFDAHVLSFKEKIRKPDERIYQTAAKACHAKPEEIFYIDDREDLTDAAKELGFHTFMFKHNPRDLIKKMKGLKIL